VSPQTRFYFTNEHHQPTHEPPSLCPHKDEEILKIARANALEILENDPTFDQQDNWPIKMHIEKIKNKDLSWSRIS
jgi:hypothetical protein